MSHGRRRYPLPPGAGKVLNCPLCSSQGVDHDAAVSACLASPLDTGIYLCGFGKLDSMLHRAIDKWFVERMNAGKNRFLIMVPRGTLKTTYFGTSTIVWRNIRDREARTLLVMSAAIESAKTSDAVKTVHMSDAMKHFFPDRVHDTARHTGKTGFLNLERNGVYREHTLEARGATSAMTGGHFPWQIFDDLIDENMAESVKDQERVIKFFQGSSNMFVDKVNDTRLVIGTYWQGPFYDWLLEQKELLKHYETLILGAEVDYRFRAFLASIGKRTNLIDGDPIWPENETRESLEHTKLEQGPLIYARQMLNIPTLDEDRRFREEDFEYFELHGLGWQDGECIVSHPGKDGRHWVAPSRRMFRTLVIDPATGISKQSDDSAISVCGEDPDTGNKYVLEEWAGNVQTHALIDQIMLMCKKWNPHKVAPEAVSYQHVLKTFLLDRMARDGVYYHIDPVKPHGKGKLSRIDALQPYVRAHRLYVQRCQFRLVDELCKLIIVRGELQGKSPNRADALAYHCEFWNPTVFAPSEAEPDIPYWQEEYRSSNRDDIPSYGLEAAL